MRVFNRTKIRAICCAAVLLFACLGGCATTVTPFVRDIHVGTDGMLVVDQCQLVETPSHAQRMSVEDCHLAAYRAR